MTSALGLSCLLFFSITGITLNHPDWFASTKTSHVLEEHLPDEWMMQFRVSGDIEQLELLASQLHQRWGLNIPRNIDRDEYEWVMDYQRPGGLSTAILDLESGLLILEEQDDGTVALINDLHKGRHSGAAWAALIDLVALVCIFFSVTGIILLMVHASKRSFTWPLVGLGTVIPILIYWIFVP